ncbi:hypothetical protein ABEW77_18370 [Heyndrickxia sporothermodurans]|uniref:hypothetical protein n=1 Tax=Heyndrickxia sporothermodurans TaxID=46224 RepID=UPI003D1BC312
MKMSKKAFVSILVVCSLVFGAIGAGAASKLIKITAYQNPAVKVTIDGKNLAIKDAKGKAAKVIQYKGTTYVPVNTMASAMQKPISYDSKKSTFKITKAPVSKKGIITLSSDFSESSVKNSLKTEAVALIKLYADEIVSGKTTKFNSYVDKHIMEKTSKNYVLGRKYNKDKYKQQITNVRKANNADKRKKYSNALKKVTVSKIKNAYSNKSGGSASFDFSYYPDGWTATSSVHVSLGFTRLESGKYVLQTIYIN